MKKHLYLAIALLISASSYATVYTVNNQSGSDADFTAVSTAIASAMTGDTLYIQPSPNNYGDVNLNKRLVLMGAGHNPTFSQYNTSFGTLTFAANSGASIVKGIQIMILTNSSNVVCNNVVISGCRVSYGGSTPLSFTSGTLNNWTFEGCIIENFSGQPTSMAYLGSNLVVRNSFLYTSGASYSVTDAPAGTHFDHNFFMAYGASAYYATVTGNNILLTNNIISTTASSNYGASYYCPTCEFYNNLLSSFGGAFPDSFNSTNLIVGALGMVNFYQSSAGYTYNYNFQLTPESLGNNAANDGTDIGVYGGIFNFSPIGADSGTPQIVDFTLGSSTAPQGGTITIHLNANGTGQ
jgi:hypothetical protein